MTYDWNLLGLLKKLDLESHSFEWCFFAQVVGADFQKGAEVISLEQKVWSSTRTSGTKANLKRLLNVVIRLTDYDDHDDMQRGLKFTVE